MKKRPLKGFDDIKANARLVATTKRRMLGILPKSKSKFPVPKPVIAAVFALALVAALIAGIANGTGGRYFLLTAKAQDLMQGIAPQKTDLSGAVNDSFINSTANFSVGLFKNLYKDEKDGQNALVSPVSACLALGMTANGASGDTRAAFLNVLGKYGMSVDSLDRAYKAYADALTEKRGGTTLTLSNAVWFDKNFAANTDFLQANADYFGAAAKKLDFNDQGSVGVINDWVKSSTDGKIDRMIDRIDPDAVLFLLNAVYFNGKWQTPFDADEKPQSGSFYPESGGAVTASYMSLETKLGYAQTDSETSVLLPYDDGRLAMLLVLPQKGVTLGSYIGKMTQATLADIAAEMQQDQVSLKLPQFKATSSNSLDDALKAMGLGTAFDRNRADFSRMGDDKNGLYVSSVTQKTFLQIDEKGTEAAATTNVEMSTKSITLDTGKQVVFDRPFVYAVIDTKTDLPLFLGALAAPEAERK
jgi:Serine protease inhibitor